MSACTDPSCSCTACIAAREADLAASWPKRAEQLGAALREIGEEHMRALARALLPPLERYLIDADLARRQRVAASVVTWVDPGLRPWERLSLEDATLLLVGVFFDGPEHVQPLLVARADRVRAAQRSEVERIHRRRQMGAIGA